MDCGSLTTDFTMDIRAAQSFYEYQYFHGGDYRDYQATEQISKRNFARFIKRLLRVQPAGQLLELGCAYGYFLDLAKLHWQVTGIDISAVAISSCTRRLAGTVHCADLLETDLPRSQYDWIVGWDMIEHVAEPRKYTARTFELLRPGGWLALTTGDVSSLASRLMGRKWRLLTPPSHLTFFSRPGMRCMLHDAGYKQITFETAGYERSLDFVLFRLLGERGHMQIAQRHRVLYRFLQSKAFYIDLGDIMFVMAQKPR